DHRHDDVACAEVKAELHGDEDDGEKDAHHRHGQPDAVVKEVAEGQCESHRASDRLLAPALLQGSRNVWSPGHGSGRSRETAAAVPGPARRDNTPSLYRNWRTSWRWK